MDFDRFGALAWGAVTAVLAMSTLGIVVIWGGFVAPAGCTNADHWSFSGLYQALKDCGTLVAGIIGFSGLAWSNFYTEVKKADAVERAAKAQGQAQVGGAPQGVERQKTDH